MSSQAQGVLEGETSGPSYDSTREQAGRESSAPLLNGSTRREGVAASELVDSEVARGLPVTEPARMEETGLGARASYSSSATGTTTATNTAAAFSSPRFP